MGSILVSEWYRSSLGFGTDVLTKLESLVRCKTSRDLANSACVAAEMTLSLSHQGNCCGDGILSQCILISTPQLNLLSGVQILKKNFGLGMNLPISCREAVETARCLLNKHLHTRWVTVSPFWFYPRHRLLLSHIPPAEIQQERDVSESGCHGDDLCDWD